MDYASPILSAWTIYLLAAIVPGPDFVVISGVSMGSSRSRGLATALGVSTGTTVWVLGTVLGLTVILANSHSAAMLIRIVGGLYLIYLGVLTLRSLWNKNSLKVPKRSERSLQSAYFSGLLVNLSNPKTAIFFLSLFGVLVSEQMPFAVRAVAGIGMIVISVIWYSFVAVLFSQNQVVNAYSRLKKPIDAVLGLALIGLGSNMLRTK